MLISHFCILEGWNRSRNDFLKGFAKDFNSLLHFLKDYISMKHVKEQPSMSMQQNEWDSKARRVL